MIIAILGVTYNILLLFDKSCKISNSENNKAKEKLKTWEKVTTIVVLTIFSIILLFILLKLSYVYSFIYWTIIFLLYISILINILIKKDNENITKKELSYITIIPSIFTLLCNTEMVKGFSKYISNIYGESIIYFIFIKNIKYFIAIFFLTLNSLLIFMELRELLHIKITKTNLHYLTFDEDKYIYKNSRNKKGKDFLKNYIKDIILLIIYKSIEIIKYIYIYPLKYVYRVFIKFIKRLTNDFSIYVIITKTFSISIIASLLITYYKLLLFYKDNIIVDLYAVIITTIIIPIILNIISDLKKNKIS